MFGPEDYEPSMREASSNFNGQDDDKNKINKTPAQEALEIENVSEGKYPYDVPKQEHGPEASTDSGAIEFTLDELEELEKSKQRLFSRREIDGMLDNLDLTKKQE